MSKTQDGQFDFIKTQVDTLARKIDAPEHLLPTYGYSRDGAYPHIEVDGALLHYVVVERGKEIDRQTTRSIDELLYWVFQGVTFSIAVDYEAHHRRSGVDFRRLMFGHQLGLLGRLSPQWAARRRQQIDEILLTAPFVDE